MLWPSSYPGSAATAVEGAAGAGRCRGRRDDLAAGRGARLGCCHGGGGRKGSGRGDNAFPSHFPVIEGGDVKALGLHRNWTSP